jgi:DNA-binding NarL/FixJ family response regulator/predicted transcriptional regulator
MWRAVGIGGVEERVYCALLRDPEISPADGAGALGLSPQRYHAAIRRLVEVGLLEHTAGASRRARPVDPRVAVGSLVRARQAELDRLAADVDQLATDFYHGRLRADPGMVIEVLEGAPAVVARIRDLLSCAGQSLAILDAPPYVMDPDECEALERAALRRGVRVRSLYAADVLTNPGKVDYITGMARAGEQGRLLRTLPVKLFVVDRATALLPLTGSEGGDRFRAVAVQRSALTEALQALFEVLWRQATPWPTEASAQRSAAPRGSGAALTDAEQSLLRHLVTGMPDEAIARQLGCSRRTLRRRVDALLDKLGAASRFQAGAVAVQRGWL